MIQENNYEQCVINMIKMVEYKDKIIKLYEEQIAELVIENKMLRKQYNIPETITRT